MIISPFIGIRRLILYESVVNMLRFNFRLPVVTMVLKRTRKTNSQGQTPEHVMKEAVSLVESGTSIRNAAKKFSISKSTLQRYVEKVKSNGPNIRMKPAYDHQRVFTDNEEVGLVTPPWFNYSGYQSSL